MKRPGLSCSINTSAACETHRRSPHTTLYTDRSIGDKEVEPQNCGMGDASHMCGQGGTVKAFREQGCVAAVVV